MADFSLANLSKNFSFGPSPAIGIPKSPSAYGNWQTYAGFNPNAAGMAGAMANPTAFSQFQDYAGMTGVAPPQESSKQAVAPTFAQVQERFGQVADQLKQGNLMDALKTYQSGPKPVAPVQPQPKIQTDPQQDVMSFEFGD